VPHVALESDQGLATSTTSEPKLVKLHKGEQKNAEYLALLNPNARCAVLVADGRPLNRLSAIVDFLDPQLTPRRAGLLPSRPGVARAGTLAACLDEPTRAIRLTRVFPPSAFAESEAAQAD